MVYKDWNGASQWYALKDQNNNWALNSALSGLDSFKAYQSTNSGDTYINAQSPTGVVRINYETGSGTGVKIYGGASNLLYASFLGSTSIQFPGLAASSGSNCLQIDNSGYLTNTGHACGSGNGNGNGSVTSVVLTVPADESVSGSPITGSGTFGITRNNQAANLFLAGPCSGGSTTPVYRALCANDFPSALFDTYGAAAAAQTASLQKSNNLSDVGNAATARTNLGLGTAATQNTTAFDAAGAAASAQAASVPTTTTVNGHPLSGNVNVTAADAGAVTKTNTLGCLDGYDHLPCTVYEMGLTSESAATGSYATAYTTPAAGVYRITGNVYATTVSTTSYTVTMLVKEGQTGSVTSHGMGVVSAAIGTSESWNNGTLVTQNLNSGVAITWETSGSGTNTSGVWNVDLVIERVK